MDANAWLSPSSCNYPPSRPLTPASSSPGGSSTYSQVSATKRRRLDYIPSPSSDHASCVGSPGSVELFPTAVTSPSTYGTSEQCTFRDTNSFTSQGDRMPHQHAAQPEKQCEVTVTETSKGYDQLDTICFGMIANIPVKPYSRISSLPPFTSAYVQGSRVCEQNTGTPIGDLCERDAALLEAIQNDTDLSLCLHCNYNATKSSRTRSSLSTFTRQLCISAIIYGPSSRSDDLCDFLDDADVFLQDPVRGDRNVPYRNPQRLFQADENTDGTTVVACHVEDFEPPIDMLTSLERTAYLREATTPTALRTQLYKHQREALTFMLRRERGWSFDDTDATEDIWRQQVDESGQRFHVNNITDEQTYESPRPFSGGILADQMGLGKSLSTIALIASDKDGIQAPLGGATSCTLLVVRAPLLKTWESQFDQHVHPGRLKWRLHHGSQKIKTVVDLCNIDVVITTYNTVALEWKKLGTVMSGLFSTRWRRIVLDEAHDIRDSRRPTCKAICELDSISRWAITGTPIQNRLLDLASLLQFLQVSPYDTPASFQALVNQLAATFGQDSATFRLQRLVQCIMLRRSIGTVTLPARHDLVSRLDFTAEERALYEEIQQQSLEPAHNASGLPPVHSTMLEMINKLRRICNLGLLMRSASLRLNNSSANAWGPREAQELFNALVAANSVNCRMCSTDLCSSTMEAADHSADDNCQPAIHRCGWLVCGQCRLSVEQMQCACRRCSPGSAVPVTTMSSVNTLDTAASINDLVVPTKIQAVLTDLENHALDEKCIVFSFWTTTLDLIESGLNRKMIPYVRFDGTIGQGKRSKALDSFCSDPSIRVALLTISCGAVGLNLTAASRAYLMEPHWNPSVEQQALARIHRMGQKRPVTTVRYVMKNTLEEHVLKVQHDKIELSQLLLSDQNAGNVKDSYQAMTALLSKSAQRLEHISDKNRMDIERVAREVIVID